MFPPSDHSQDICSICRTLPREKRYSSNEKIPKNFQKLKFADELWLCPKCKNVYEYEFDQERWDGPSDFSTTRWRRLSLTEALTRLKGPELTEAKESYASRIDDLKRRLAHPVKKQRIEAAWMLCEHFLSIPDWPEISILLSNGDDESRMDLLNLFLKEQYSSLDFSHLELTFRSLLAMSARVRFRAATNLTRMFFNKGSSNSIFELLDSPDAQILSAVCYELEHAALAGKTISEFLPLLRDLARHKSERVRTASGRALTNVPATIDDNKATVEKYIELLRHKDPEVRHDAIYYLERLSGKGDIIKLLNSPSTRDRANKAILTMLRRKTF